MTKIELDEFLKLLGKRVVELFDKSEFKNQNQLHLYLDAKISTATISDLFAGKANISAYNLMLIVDALGGSADYVLFGKERKPLLAEFRKLIEETEQSTTKIDDKDIREIVLALTEKKVSQMGLFKTITKLAKLNSEFDKEKINALNVVIDSILADL